MSVYQPVSCGRHSEYELLAMHQSRVELVYTSGGGAAQRVVGRVVDVVTRDQAEYMVLKVTGMETRSIRLDKIQNLKII